MAAGHRLRCGHDHRPRLPPLDHARSAGRRPRRGLDDLGRRRARATSTPPAGRSSSTSGHGRREIAAAMAEQAGAPRVRPRQRLHHRAARGVCRGGRAAPADRRPRDLPGQRRLGGDRDGAQARPRLPPRPRRAGPLDRLRAVGELPRQHARRPGPVRAQAAPSPVRGLAGPVPAPLGGLSVSWRRSGRQRPRDRRRAGRRSWRRRSWRPARAPSPRSSPSRSSARPSLRPCRPTTTGRRSPRSAGGTASCSSPTRS